MLSDTNPEKKHWSENILLKGVIIGVIVLALMIPSFMITELVRERSYRKTEVINEVSSKWGQLQTIAGPYISIPYFEAVTTTSGIIEWREHALNFFPKSLEIKGTIEPVLKKRSIFQVMLYESDLTLKGRFEYPNLHALQISPENISWNKANLRIGITDLIGIGAQVSVHIGDTALPMTASIPVAIQFPNGLMSRLPQSIVKSPGFDFEIDLTIKGSQGIYFTPVANNTTVSLKSSWPSPKFEGQILPDTSTITANGFNVSWKILDINRQITQEWTDNSPQHLSAAIPPSRYQTTYTTDTESNIRTVIGVDLLNTVDHYTKNERTVKYAFLLITMTFVVYFFCEVLKKQKVHPMQYGLVGAALVIFFILLLSFSEHIGFDLAYLISSLTTILLITFYSRTIFTDKRYANLVGGLLLLQFGFIYIILQLEDYALLTGSIALFGIIALIMYLTRKVKW